MRSAVVILAISAAALSLWGCGTGRGPSQTVPAKPVVFQSTGVNPVLVMYSEKEIKSRSWETSSNQTIRFVKSATLEREKQVNLLVAEYGDRSTGIVTCLEFYRRVDAVVQNDRSYVLLARDCGQSSVTSVEVVKDASWPAEIQIQRESLPGAPAPRKRSVYRLTYSGENRLEEDLAGPVVSDIE